MQTYQHHHSQTQQHINHFNRNLNTPHQNIKQIQNHYQLSPQTRGLQALQCTEAESFELMSSPRKSIIDDLNSQYLKQTTCTNHLDIENQIFSIKEETEENQPSLNYSIPKLNDPLSLNSIMVVEEMTKKVVARPQPSYSKLKSLMLKELSKSQIVQRRRIYEVINNTMIARPEIKINFCHCCKGSGLTIQEVEVIKRR